MKGGFSLLELILALTVAQIGLLATVGMVLLAQTNFVRSELTLRGLLESAWTADSLAALGETGSGSRTTEWGGLVWSAEGSPVPFVRVKAWASLYGDTVATAIAIPLSSSGGSAWPDSTVLEGGS